MIRQLAATGFALSLLAGAAMMSVAHAQFADDTQTLFTGDPDQPKTDDDLLIFDLGNPEDDQDAAANSGAQTVEELCCKMTEEERAADGLCVEVQCPAE